ncbi:alpha/beta fold hydrolase [Streptomyces sp. 049-1]|uniref:alpha/beta fold hydrolase n=1 Tax=Streptomyces sp. 049-1 TaxID=2789264 RepID=UPI00397F6295
MYVLVPGAWHGAWSWTPVAKRLRAAGHHALCLDLPGQRDGDRPTGVGLQDAVDHVVSVVESLDASQATLVGHSLGGYLTLGAAFRLTGGVSKIIHCSANIPVAGQSMMDDAPSVELQQFVSGLIDSSPDGAIPPSMEFVQGMFMQDASLEAQQLVNELLVPTPGRFFTDPLDIPDPLSLGVPSAYIVGENDQALPRPGAEYARRVGLEAITVPGTHENLLTHPDEVAKAILNV